MNDFAPEPLTIGRPQHMMYGIIGEIYVEFIALAA